MYKLLERNGDKDGSFHLKFEAEIFGRPVFIDDLYHENETMADYYLASSKQALIRANLEQFLQDTKALCAEGKKKEAWDKCLAGLQFMIDRDLPVNRCCEFVIKLEKFLFFTMDSNNKLSLERLNKMIKFSKEEIKNETGKG